MFQLFKFLMQRSLITWNLRDMIVQFVCMWNKFSIYNNTICLLFPIIYCFYFLYNKILYIISNKTIIII